MQVNSNQSKVSANNLANKWNIGLEIGRYTMNENTQKSVCTSTEPLSIRVRVYHLDLHLKILKGTWYADTSIYKVKSITGNTVANVYTQGNFVIVYSITSWRK